MAWRPILQRASQSLTAPPGTRAGGQPLARQAGCSFPQQPAQRGIFGPALFSAFMLFTTALPTMFSLTLEADSVDSLSHEQAFGVGMRPATAINA